MAAGKAKPMIKVKTNMTMDTIFMRFALSSAVGFAVNFTCLRVCAFVIHCGNFIAQNWKPPIKIKRTSAVHQPVVFKYQVPEKFIKTEDNESDRRRFKTSPEDKAALPDNAVQIAIKTGNWMSIIKNGENILTLLRLYKAMVSCDNRAACALLSFEFGYFACNFASSGCMACIFC